MGVGGSTSRPNSATVIMSTKRPQSSSPDLSIKRGSAEPRSSPPDNRPTNSCCSHYRDNHAGVTRTVTPAEPQKDDSIDDEIEEIVANTLDLVSNQRTPRQQTPHLRDTDRGGGTIVTRDVTSSTSTSGVGQRTILRSESVRRLQKRPSDEDSDVQFDAKEAIPEVDFAKFKKVNHQVR
ncbi:uncharacterized protein NPIL_20221 [Nephila pilipes]|uniref:Uncharacterized protein n=1 Tax=Nephila pilipes TaxID=299642 RepID=A0A8X6TMH8_NEPPI|nr:uncharacterized protein NPIL_20221 [Nephila pilipes]